MTTSYAVHRKISMELKGPKHDDRSEFLQRCGNLMKFGVENSLKWSEIGNLLHGFAEKLWVPKFEKPLFFVLEHCFPIFPKPPVARGQMSFFFLKACNTDPEHHYATGTPMEVASMICKAGVVLWVLALDPSRYNLSGWWMLSKTPRIGLCDIKYI